MLGFNNFLRRPAAPGAPDAKDQKIYELETHIVGLEEALMEMCFLMKQHLDRIDHNTQTLDKNMRRLTALTLRSPKDLLGGGQEPN
jgi:hypothetical protein